MFFSYLYERQRHVDLFFYIVYFEGNAKSFSNRNLEVKWGENETVVGSFDGTEVITDKFPSSYALGDAAGSFAVGANNPILRFKFKSDIVADLNFESLFCHV